ncbi:hypothetical protein BE221DRAFT_105265 [Ostreococcus tauri]|uniref:Enhancer of mRNA-decapping protein 4 C-terminal domain-containing protein n=1 Tax=Ostreococcus tauri TaxID=70448 RepID=A0A1Y5HYG1_OSTTA|nr:hypothetical protein BE221DRAFT_105265 [Ostreococcus tauri]
MEETIDVERVEDGEASSAMEVSPITVYETKYAEAQTRMIAVNDSFICYGIRNGLIRVFSRKTSNVRSLLRGHSDSISTLKFLANTDVLLSVDFRGRVMVRKLSLLESDMNSLEDDGANGTITAQTLVDFDFQVDTPEGHWPPSVCWMPLDSRKPGRCEFALSAGTCVVCYEFSLMMKGDAPALEIDLNAPPAMSGLQVIEFDAPVSCVDSAPVGRKIVAASEGRAYVLVKADGETEFECTDTLPWTVETAVFASADRVILGNENNSELIVVDVTQETPFAVQRVVFKSDNDKLFNVGLQHNPETGIVLLSNTRMNAVYALHFDKSFDYIARFEASQPILSFDANVIHEEDGGAKMQLFCMQTQAIQTLSMAVEACVPPEGALAVVGSPGTPKRTLEHSSSATLLTPDMFGGAELAGDEEDEEPNVSLEKRILSAPAMAERVDESENDEDDGEEFESAEMSESMEAAMVSRVPVASVDMKQIRAIIRDEMRDILDELRAERRKAAEERATDMERARKASEAAAANLKRDITSAIATLMQQHSVENAKTLEAGVGRAQSVAATSAQTALKSIVGPSIDGAVRAHMETSVVPKMEMACATMFSQVKQTFERGMLDLNTELLAARESAAIAQVTPFVSGLRQATTEIRQAATALMTDVPNQVAQAMSKITPIAPPPGMSPKSVQGKTLAQIEQRLDPTAEIGKLLQANQIDRAFNVALSMSKVEVVMWLITQVASDRIFGQNPCPLSQGVLLSLVQQLSSDLATPDARTKLDWIRDSCLAIDPADPSLRQHMRPVLSGVHQALMAASNSPASAPDVRAGTRLCIHVVNSMLSSL